MKLKPKQPEPRPVRLEPVITTETWHHPSGSAHVKMKICGTSRDVTRLAKKLYAAIGVHFNSVRP